MATIYAYSSDYIYCTYSLSISRNGSTITVKASGTIYGNGSSTDSGNNLYAHLRYNVSPANTSNTTTYVSDYGSSFGNGVKIVSAPLNGSSIPPSGKTFSASWTITNNEAVTYNNCALFLSKTSTGIDTLNNNAYTFIGKRSSSINGNKLRYYTQNLSIEAGYTACTAPTSVTANASIVKQGDNVTISWSGASAGTNNAISKYRVFYKKGSSPTTSTYDGYKDSTSTSVNIKMSGARGNNYYFKVQSIGSVSGYNSDISSAYATSKVNQLPPAPTVTPNKSIVPSSGGLVIFTLSATDPDSQTTSFYYSTSAEGTKTEISSGDSISVDNTTTYYFYSYDGLEYSSSYTSKTITKNIKPTISISSQGAGTLYTSDLLTNNSYKNFYTQVTGTANLSKAGSTITWYGRYATIPSSGTISNWDIVNLGVNNNTTVTHDLSSNKIFKTLSNIVYQIGAKCNDGIEDSDTAWDNTNFVIAPIPIIGDFINQYGTTNVNYSTANHFYNQASIVATKDSSVISVTTNITNNAAVSTLSDTISNYKTNGYFKINITNTNINTVYTLTFTINRVIGSVTKTFTITSAGLPYKSGGATLTSSDISNQTNILKPYTDNGTFIITLYNFFETLSYSSAKKNYDGTELPTSCLSFDFVKGSKILNIIPIYSSDSSASSLCFTYNKDFYKTQLLNGENPLELDLETINSIDLRITFRDVFGQSYILTKTNYLTLDFREPFINNDGFSLTVLREGVVATDNIQEGDTIQLSLDWQSYNTQVATIETYIYRSSTTVSDLTTVSWERYQNDSNYIWTIDTSKESPSNLIRSGTGTNNYTVSQLNKSNYVYFKIITTINGQSKNYYTDSYRITQRHISIPSVGFSSVSYDANNKQIKYTHTSYDSGGGNTPNDIIDTSGGIQTLEIGIQYSVDFNSESSEKKYISYTGVGSDSFVALITRPSSEPEITIADEESSITEYTQSFTIENWSYYNIRLVFKTTINSIVKISYGEEITIYNLAPTISYRKNQIGINIKPESADRLDELTISENIKDTGAVVIQATSGKENIYIISADNVLKIKMTDGSIDGAIIDCGTW